MLIESDKPLKVKLPTGEVRLTPGVPIEFSKEQGQKLLAKAGGKVRIVQPVKPYWLIAWREVAALTQGITGEDSRFSRVMAALDECDNAFRLGDWLAFHRAAEQVRTIVHR